MPKKNITDIRPAALMYLRGLIIAIGFSNACLAWADNHSPAELNALVIQADFAGLVMTGVAYNVSRELDVFNVRPLIPLYDIAAASASLEYNAQTWPSGTVFVSVVDPGVGTARKSVVLKTSNGLYFVSPDNGSLSGPADAYGIDAVREIDEKVNRIPGSEWSHTFHGRDVYSYTGARLAAGVITFEQVGPLLEAQVIKLAMAQGELVDGAIHGYVAGGAGRLGNIYFNVDRDLFASIKPDYGDLFSISISHKGSVVWRGEIPYARSFGAVPVGENLLFMNSSGALSLAINQGSFAQTYSIQSGTDWEVTVAKK
jgi:S-adenosylmethionine hydrolase